jgi:hypothetical protein
MSNKESLKLFRRNSQFLADNINSFTGGMVSLKQQHEREIQTLFEEGSSDEEGGWGGNHVDNMVYSDTDSSDDDSDDLDDDSDASDDEFAEKKNEVAKKLQLTQRRFATLFDQNDKNLNVPQAVENRKRAAQRQNVLVPQPVEEEDFRNRSKGRVRHENYFGDQAKSSFLSRYHWVAQEQSVLDNGSEALVHHTIFEENTKENSHTIEFPFMPRRPGNPDDMSVASEDPFEDDNVSLLFCNDFDIPEDTEEAAASIAETYDTHSVATLDLSAAMQFNRELETSPRTKFIAACIQAKVHPRASLLLRRNVSAELNLQHQGGWVGGAHCDYCRTLDLSLSLLSTFIHLS